MVRFPFGDCRAGLIVATVQFWGSPEGKGLLSTGVRKEDTLVQAQLSQGPQAAFLGERIGVSCLMPALGLLSLYLFLFLLFSLFLYLSLSHSLSLSLLPVSWSLCSLWLSRSCLSSL